MQFWKTKSSKLGFVTLLLILVSACGQIGPLYLPENASHQDVTTHPKPIRP